LIEFHWLNSLGGDDNTSMNVGRIDIYDDYYDNEAEVGIEGDGRLVAVA
jgi:hypothetical protein